MCPFSSETAACPVVDNPALLDPSNPEIASDGEMMEVEEVKDLSNSPKKAAEDYSDISKVMDSKGIGNRLESGAFCKEKPKEKLLSDDLVAEKKRGNFKSSGSRNLPSPMQKELHVSHDGLDYPTLSKQPPSAQKDKSQELDISKKDYEVSPKTYTNKDQNMFHTNGETHIGNSEIMDAENTSPYKVSEKEVATTIPERDRPAEETDQISSKEEIKQMDMHSGDNKQRMQSRLTSATVRTRSLFSDAEVKNGNKRPAVICNFFAKGWCVKGDSCRFLHVKDDTNKASQLLDEKVDAATVERKVLFGGGSNDVVERLGLPASPELVVSSVRNDASGSSLYRHSGALLSNYHSGNPLSYINNLEYVQNGSLGGKRLLDGDREFHNSRLSSLLRNSSPFFSCEPRKAIHSTDFKIKMSSNDWEPSVPFRPSFFVTPTGISSPGSQYDPLRDSIDLPRFGPISFKFSFSSVGASTLNTSGQEVYGDSVFTRTVAPECNGDKSSVSSHSKSHENVLDKNCHALGKDSYTTGAELVGTSVVDGQNGTDSKKDNASGSTQPKDVSTAKNMLENGDERHQLDASSCRREPEVGRVCQNSETDVDSKVDGDACKESRALRLFRASLVDFVKELLKPAWREGHLSKDAHNAIVRKAVEKVISTLQTHRIPTTMELIKQYLSISQPKIAKLIEGYVDKYRRS